MFILTSFRRPSCQWVQFVMRWSCYRWWKSWRKGKASRSQRSCRCRHGYVWLSWGKPQKVCLCSWYGRLGIQAEHENQRNNIKERSHCRKEITFFDWSPPRTTILTIWHIYSDNIWQSFWHILWHCIWHSVWHLFWHSFWHSIWSIFEGCSWGAAEELEAEAEEEEEEEEADGWHKI